MNRGDLIVERVGEVEVDREENMIIREIKGYWRNKKKVEGSRE